MSHFNNIQTIETDDGSTTLYLPGLNETYHSRRGAQTESEYIYIDRGIGALTSQSLRVLEIGFGTGLNAILTVRYARENQLNIEYDTYEPFPLDTELLQHLHFPVLNEDPLYSSLLIKMHSQSDDHVSIIGDHFSFEFTLNKIRIEDAILSEGHYDVVYYDAFAPSKQAEIWAIDNLIKVYRSMKPGGRLVTYCSQGQFKRNLKEVGFITEHPSGPLGKKEMTIAVVPAEK